MKPLALAALLAAAPLAALPAAAQAQNWNTTFEQTQAGHKVGNPQADLQLIAFVSYTCPHCAHFEQEADAALRAGYIHTGDVALEVRHMIRNPIDLAAAMISECGEEDTFFGNHRRIMLAHESWMEKARSATREQQQRWMSGDFGSRMRAIAGDLDFYDLMEPRGLSRAQIDRCLADTQKAEAIAIQSNADSEKFDLPGTPSFVLNGQLLQKVHGWGPLRQALDKAKAENSAG